MRNGLACILALWTFVANPALCVAGMWVRECPEPCTCCEDGCDPCTHHGCEDDPCQISVIQAQKSWPQELRPATPAVTVAIGPDLRSTQVSCACTGSHLGAGPPPGSTALSARVSPLLI